MKYYRINQTWVQSVGEDGWMVDAWDRGGAVAIIKSKDKDPMGPRVGKEISQEEFNQQYNEINQKFTT